MALTTTTTTTGDHDTAADEDRLIHEWRARQLERLGLPRVLAHIWADQIDWHEIAALLERGCSLGLALEIVR
jgi:hypothetical protein